MMQPEVKQCAHPVAAATTTQTQPLATGSTGIMDMVSRMRAMKFFNVILARLWRRRCSEVVELQELVRQYESKTNNMRHELFKRNQMICLEQRRLEHRETELRRVHDVSDLNMRRCETIEKALNVANGQKLQLSKELEAKTLECNNASDLLNESRTEMLRELSKHEECAKELAEQQRHNRWLEIRNAELEDELRTLKDRFQSQHDDFSIALHTSQSQLDGAYESLKDLEHQLAEFQHITLLKEIQEDCMFQVMDGNERKIGIMPYAFNFFIVELWPKAKFILHEIMANFLVYIHHHNPLPVSTLPITAVAVFSGFILLIGATK